MVPSDRYQPFGSVSDAIIGHLRYHAGGYWAGWPYTNTFCQFTPKSLVSYSTTSATRFLYIIYFSYGKCTVRNENQQSSTHEWHGILTNSAPNRAFMLSGRYHLYEYRSQITALLSLKTLLMQRRKYFITISSTEQNVQINVFVSSYCTIRTAGCKH